MSSKLVAFLIGPSRSIGADLIATWKQHGYHVAVGSRNIDVEKERKEGRFAVNIDVANSSSIIAAFEAVNKELGPLTRLYTMVRTCHCFDDHTR